MRSNLSSFFNNMKKHFVFNNNNLQNAVYNKYQQYWQSDISQIKQESNYAYIRNKLSHLDGKATADAETGSAGGKPERLRVLRFNEIHMLLLFSGK